MKPECQDKCFSTRHLLSSHRPGTLSHLPGGNEPAPPKYGCPASDIFSASYQRHPGEPAPSSIYILTFFCFPFSSPPSTNSGILSGQWLWPSVEGMEVVTLLCVSPPWFGGPYCLCSLSCFKTKGGAFESPKKEKRPHRRWRSRAIGKDTKGMLQVTIASPTGWFLPWPCSACHLLRAIWTQENR